ncbi:hypothetical protein ACLK2E_09405 [Escherichia coli]
MMKVDAVKRGTFDRQIPIAVRSSWRGAMERNGNGLCFNFDAKSPMCPSMKVSNHRINSPKGRATLVREWLRLLADRGIDPNQLEKICRKNAPACVPWWSAPAIAGTRVMESTISRMRLRRRCPAAWRVKPGGPSTRSRSTFRVPPVCCAQPLPGARTVRDHPVAAVEATCC